MVNNKHMIFTAKSVNDILYQIKTISGLKIIGGATAIGDLPEKSLSIRNIPELLIIDKHERYIEFGPAVTLNSVLHLGPAFLPSVLYEAISSTANHAIRNTGTLGGNIMAKDPRLSLLAPLLALNSTLKFRNQKTTEVIPLSKLDSANKDSVLTSIRIPTEDWNVAIFRRLGPANRISNNSCSFCFLARTEKNVLIDLRVSFTGPFIFSSKELETKYLGTRLPVSNSVIEDFIQIADKEYDESYQSSLNISEDIPVKEISKDETHHAMLKKQFLNLIAYSLHELT